ncbi:MAG: VanW family protein [Candidatus Peribacteraceae bacterium]|nr:VanW family protein [Candidatus Peribacteraceae bacterium]MDD5075129.1 VanW family protein [Candidatus Peribacteraceae bacterium]
MNKSDRHLLANLLALGSMTLLFLIGPATRPMEDRALSLSLLRMQSPFSFQAVAALAYSEATLPDSPALRVAKRLANRLAKHQRTRPPLTALVSAVEEQHVLLRKHLSATLNSPSSPKPVEWEISLQRYPEWIQPIFTATDAHFHLNPDSIGETLKSGNVNGVILPVGAVLTGTGTDKGILRAKTDGVAKSGTVFDVPQAITAITTALEQDKKQITLTLKTEAGHIDNQSGEHLGDLVLLGSGRSDFKGSPWGRVENIKKALREHVNNVIVPAGSTYSFNATLGGPVTESRGWKMAKVIFEANQLVMAPGGGICQTSTTAFRAILNAGFRVVDRQNHSMYVSYYEKYGVGIDATVFPGLQDLTFVNDSGNDLLIQAYDEGTEAVVNVYGTPDGRSATVKGPYFASSDLTGYPANERSPRSNEIIWVQEVTFADGSTQDNLIISRYTSLPRSIVAKYALQANIFASGSTVVSER